MLQRTGGARLPEMALRFCLDHPIVASTFVEMATQQQVTENVHALESADNSRLTAEVLAALEPDRNIVWRSGGAENAD